MTKIQISALEFMCVSQGAKSSSLIENEDWCPYQDAKCPFYDPERAIRIEEFDNEQGKVVPHVYRGCEYLNQMGLIFQRYMADLADMEFEE